MKTDWSKEMQDSNNITSFRGDYAFLSNFYRRGTGIDSSLATDFLEIRYKGRYFYTTEAAYMSEKNDTDEWKDFCSTNSDQPGKVKRYSKSIPLVGNWDRIKVQVMHEVLCEKFNQDNLFRMLKQTEGKVIIEGNSWKDEFWGVNQSTGQGLNVLGLLLMSLRDTEHPLVHYDLTLGSGTFFAPYIPVIKNMQ